MFQRVMELLNTKKTPSVFLIVLIASMPVAMAAEFDFEEAETDEEYGENLIIEAKEYQPTVVPASLMEEESIPVKVILSAIRSNVVDIPKNIHVKLKLLDEKAAGKINTSLSGTSEEVKTKYFRSYSWRPNSYPTLDNLGYLEIRLKKVPKEEDVPDQIDLDFRAEITYKGEVTEMDIGGSPTFSNLPVESEEQFEDDLDKHMFWNGAGYVRVVSATDKSITLQFYDADLQKKHKFSISKGRVSGKKRIDGHPLYNYFRVKYNGLVDKDIKINFIGVSGEKKIKETVAEGWFISDLNKEENYVILKNSDLGIEIPLVRNGYSTEFKHDEGEKKGKEFSFNYVAELGFIVIDECGEDYKEKDSRCMIFRTLNREDVSADFVSKSYTGEEVEKFLQGLEDLDNKGLESVESIISEDVRKARIKIGDNVYLFEKEIRSFLGRLLGEDGKEDETEDAIERIGLFCKLNSIGKDYINIGYVGSDSDWKGKSQTLEIGESPRFDCGARVTYLGPSTDKKPSFTILAGEGRSKSISDFSIHILIEKRAWDLSPDEIDEQIRKTREKIQKLDETIEKLNKIVEGWTKVCLSTAAIFTVFSFFGGGKEARAEARAREIEAKPKVVDKEDLDSLEYYKDGWKELPGGKLYMDEDGNCYADDKYRIGIPCNRLRSGGDYYFIDEKGVLERVDRGSDGTFSRSRNSALYGNAIVFGNNGDIRIPIHDKSALPSGDSQCQKKYKEFINLNPNAAVFLQWDRSQKTFYVFHAGYDNKVNYDMEQGNKDDYQICYFDENDDEGKKYVKKLSRIIKDRNSGQQKTKFGDKYYEINSKSMVDGEMIQCEDVMSSTHCLFLYNACDPVICPSSRCNFGGQYQVDNVVQSGLIGSSMLCLPNFNKGIIMPVCLSGILASLKTIRSVLQGYVNCLEAAKVSGKSVGICDKIRSIYICEIIWKEMLVFLKMKGGVFQWLFDKSLPTGGREYVRGGFEGAGATIDFFTNNYAKNIFAAYKGRAAQEIGSEICRSAIYGKTPWYGDIVGKVSDAQNPPQFTAYVEEHTYSDIGIRKQSRYQVYYHIYAGSNEVDYKIYLRKPGKNYKVDSGRLDKEGFVDENPDFVEESGFEEICVYINDRPYCGFGKIASTSFAVNAINDYMMGYSMGKTIESEEHCRAGNIGIGEYIPQAQIRRVCSTIDPNINKGGEIWKKVGTCGKNEAGVYLGDCWMEVSEIKDRNPDLYYDASMEVCENQGYKVCKVGFRCPDEDGGIIEIGKGKKDVICCSQNCIENEGYTGLRMEIDSVVVESVYKKMKERAETLCEKRDIVGNDPFDYADENVRDWGSKENEIDELVEEYGNVHEKVAYHNYFKGLMYLMCGDCGSTKESFNKIEDKEDKYYKRACGEYGNAGIFKSICPEDTCVSEEKAEEKEMLGTEFKVKRIKLELEDYNGKTYDYYINGDSLIVDYAGIYTIESIEFNKPLIKCSIKDISFKEKEGVALEHTGEIKGIVSQDNKNVCVISESKKINLQGLLKTEGGIVKLDLYAESEFDNQGYDRVLDITVNSPLHVGERIDPMIGDIYNVNTILCYYSFGEDYSCLNFENKKCSDYYDNYPVYNQKQIYFANPNDCFDYCSNTLNKQCVLTEYKQFGP